MAGSKDARTDGRTLRRGLVPPRYHSQYDGPPPRYDGPVWIGKPITPPPQGVGPEWIGRRIVERRVPRQHFSTLPPGGWMDA